MNKVLFTKGFPAIHSKMDHGKTPKTANPAMGHSGHDPHAMMIADFRKRFYVVLVLTVPIIPFLDSMIRKISTKNNK